MKNAYHAEWLYNLAVIKESKRWFQQHLITAEQLSAIHNAYPSEFYHPNFIIRILLFVATLLALSGVTGLLGLAIADIGEAAIWIGSFVYGVVSFFLLELIFIANNKHYKSGVTEAMIYHASVFTLIGLCGFVDFDNVHFMLLAFCVVFAFSAIRYLDLVCTVVFTGSLAALLFYELYEFGEVARQLIPFVFIIMFTPLYFYCRKLKKDRHLRAWTNNLITLEALSLILVYLAGNYLVVRELQSEMMGVYLEEGEDIPFAIVFYFLTVLIPIAYLYFGIRKKDIVLLRVSLVLTAFSVFTFKYYYSLGHPEITFTIAGGILIIISMALLNYLKVMKHGFTRENLLNEKWGDSNLQAFIVSQTLAGNEVTVNEEYKGGGGGFSGGGASGDF